MAETPSTPAEPAGTPAVDARVPPSSEPLFSPKQIALASFLATPIAGALLASANLRALGLRGARAVIVAAAVVVAVIFGVDVWGAGAFSVLALPCAAVVTWVLAAIAFAPALERAGTRDARGVIVAVVAVWLGLGVVGGGVVGAMTLHAPTVDEALGDVVHHSEHERVSFTGAARRADADEVARALAASGAFTGKGGLRVSVERQGDRLSVRLVVPSEVSLADLDAARRMLARMTRHLEPARCIHGDLVTPDGSERASGTLCP